MKTSHTKKNWAFSVKIKGISDIRRKRRQKCEKISPKPEQFSNPLPVWFFKISYFSHGVYISKNKGKIRNLQKTVNFCPRKVFRFSTLKNWKMAFLLNFDQIYLNKEKSFKLWVSQESWDLFKRFSKHPQIVSIGFHMSEWQLLEHEVFWDKFLNFSPKFEKQWKFSEN